MFVPGFVSAALLGLFGCSGSSHFTIGGTVSGLAGTGLVLQDSSSDNLAVKANGAFTFAKALSSGGAYAVTVEAQPSNPTQICTVTNGAGRATANVTSVQISCKSDFKIGGTVTGLAGTGLALQDNGGDTLAISVGGTFTFPTAIPQGNAYAVTVESQPSDPTQICAVTNGSGTASGSVTNIQVSCSAGWTWLGGSNTINGMPVYGTKGVASSNNSPGPRINPVTSTDAAGNFWLFGGYGSDSTGMNGDLNDLWEFSAGAWKWVGGSNVAGQSGSYGTRGQASASNVPGARYQAVSWTDASGNFWLFGGTGLDSTGSGGELNDLWKFSSGEWTWMSGPNTTGTPAVGPNVPGVYGVQGAPGASNIPGGRFSASSWVDASGDLWLFGGEGLDSTGNIGLLNDLWKYSDGAWTWVSGSNVANQYGVYGVMATANAGNVPGARVNAVSWTDTSGNLWLFGGFGNDSNGILCTEYAGSVPCVLNDLWKFSAGQWTWMGGSNLIAQQGSYGSEGTPAPGNVPGARYGAVSWTDAGGDFWLFGGFGLDSTGSPGYINDLWEYNGGQWTWIDGATLADQAGVYGTEGVIAAGNLPGARDSGASWIDKQGDLWLFGGTNLQPGGGGNLNDLWEYQGWGINGKTPNRPAPPPSYTIGGAVSGLAGAGLVLADDASDNLAIGSNGSFTFATSLPSGSSYSVSVLAQPASQYCVAANGSGIASADVTAIQITCTTITAGHDQWTWVSGAASVNQAGTYGTLGTAASANAPGARIGASTWRDKSGNLWLFGGNDGSLQTGIIGAGGKIHLTYFDFNDLWKFSDGEWTWIRGSNTSNKQAGVYGTLGVASAGNQPGARHGAVTWTDASGNFWLFGGIGIDSTKSQGDLNDLWEYSAGMWIWMSGSNLANQSGSYGTQGVADPANAPGARDGAISWIDATGNLWLFGGFGYDSSGSPCFNIQNAQCYLNDLWKYSAGEWTWVGGPATSNDPGSFGTEGTASASNYPSARQDASAWVDKSGNVWIFGGNGIDSTSDQGPLNDLWELSGGQWAWMNGSSQANAQGVYGAPGLPAAGDSPGARMAALNWADAEGNLWLFGGLGNDSADNYGALNDLWEYTSSQWIWIGGNSLCCELGTYGVLGTASVGNIPAARYSGAQWVDASGNFWLFGGGIGFSVNQPDANFSDLWEYQP